MSPDIAKQLADHVKAMLAERDSAIAELRAQVKELQERPLPKDGKDGAPGEKGEKGDPGDVAALNLSDLENRVKSLEERPQPRDGRDGLAGPKGDPGERGMDGKNGQDGWSPDHFGFVMNPDGTGAFKMIAGDREKSWEFRLPVLVDRGVYKAEHSYLKGHGVTYGGDYWICREDNPGPIGKDFEGWRLVVRKGRDARGAKV